jgi:hypothetical protein
MPRDRCRIFGEYLFIEKFCQQLKVEARRSCWQFPKMPRESRYLQRPCPVRASSSITRIESVLSTKGSIDAHFSCRTALTRSIPLDLKARTHRTA